MLNNRNKMTSEAKRMRRRRRRRNKDVYNKNGNEAVLNDFCDVCQQIKQVVNFPVEMLIYKC